MTTNIQFPTLTISLTAQQSVAYIAELAFSRPSTAADRAPAEGIAAFDFGALSQAGDNPKSYGILLAQALFADQNLREFFTTSLALAQASAQPYRIHLQINSNAPELHTLRWETLCHPQTGAFLGSDANLRWSREIFSLGWEEIELRPKGELRILLAVANPADLKGGARLLGQTLPEVDVLGEVKRARAALRGVGQVDLLVSRQRGPWQVTRANLAARLLQGYDILYLVCHGALLPEDPFDPNSPRKPFLLLEQADGRRDRFDGDLLVRQMAELETAQRPRLVVLASCQSAGQGTISDPGAAASGDKGALAALGPKLAEAGVPAVIAMQGDVKMKTVETFMPVFLQELVKDGQLERAVALARSASRAANCSDWWAPALYTRLKDGQLFSSLTVGGDPLKEYLSIISPAPSFDTTHDPSLKTLWEQVPYRAREAGQTSGQAAELRNLLRELFPIKAKDRYQHAVLLGSPGQGKTTALQWLLSSSATESLKQLSAGKRRPDPSSIIIPIYVSMNDLRENVPIDRLALTEVNSRLETMGVPPIRREQFFDWSQNYRLLFLIDDLEALITRRHGIGVEALIRSMREPPLREESFLIACRSSSYQNQMGRVYLLELVDLAAEDVQFVLGKEHMNRLSPQIRMLAQNRAMLSLILDFKDQNFNTKGQLMQIWVERQLHLDSERFEGMDTFLLKTVLGQLAFEMRRDHRLTCDESRVIELISSYLESRQEKYHWRDVLDHLRNFGILKLEPAGRCYSFAERPYADYFSAAAVAADPAILKQVLDTVSDYWWRDMLEILVGLQEDPSELMYEIIDRNAIVGALCIQNSPIDPKSPVYSALSDGLAEQMDLKSSSRRKEIVNRIIESGHPRVPEVLMRRLHREWSSQVILSIARGLERWKHKPGKIRQELIKTEAMVLAAFPEEMESYREWLEVKTPVCRNLGDCKEDEAVLDELIKLKNILDDNTKPKKMRGLAAISLGLSGYPQAGKWLLELLQRTDVDDLVAWCVVEAAAQFPRPEFRKQIFIHLQNFTSPDFMKDQPRYRARQIYLLGWMKAEDYAMKPTASNELPSHAILMQALKDCDPLVRGFAIEAMVRLNLKGMRGMVEKMLAKEKDALVLRKAAEALGQIGTRDTINLLESKLRADVVQTNQSVRSSYRNAIQEIQERLGI